MPSLSHEARTRYLSRLNWTPKLSKVITREDSQDEQQSRYDSASSNSKDARQRYLARIAGRTYSPPTKPASQSAYREDSDDKPATPANDPLAWFRAHLIRSGYSKPLIEKMLAT